MNGKTIVSSIIIGILGLVSTGLALVFEFLPDRLQGRLFYFTCTNYLCVGYECLYFRSPAFYMVIGAVVCMIVALILISISADCGCGRATYSSSGTRALAILAFVFCWLISLAAIILLIIGGLTQYGVDISKIGHGKNLLMDENNFYKSCYKVKKGIFGGAAASSFIGVTLGIVSYVALVCEDKKIRRRNQA